MKLFIENLNYFVLAIGIVFIWRGVWGLADKFLFPESPILSFVISILIGVTILLLNNIKDRDIKELVE